MVAGTLCASVVARMKMTWAGGSSSGFEQGVEGCLGELVYFVDDIEAETARRGCHADALAQFADFVDATIGGAVNLQHIQRATVPDGDAGDTTIARLGPHPVRAVECFSKQASDAGLAGATRSREEIGVGHPLLADSVRQGAGNVLLPHHGGKCLRAPFTVEGLVRHRSS